MKIGAVILAAGFSRRFGGNKLTALLNGRPMVCYTLEAVGGGGFDEVCVVTGHAEIAALADAQGFRVVTNGAPQLGQSYSIVLGTQTFAQMDAVCFVPGDQPRLRGASLLRLTHAMRTGGKGIVCLCDDTHRGIPAAFRAEYFEELLQLRGDCGARGILQSHENDVLAVRCTTQGELADVDTREALRAMKGMVNA